MPFFLAGRAMLGRDGAEFSRIVLHRALRSMFAGRGRAESPETRWLLVTQEQGWAAGPGSNSWEL